MYEFNKEVLEKSPAGIIRLDKNLKIEYDNYEMRKFLDLHPDNMSHLKGTNITELQLFDSIPDFRVFQDLKQGKMIQSDIIFSQHSQQKFAIMKGVPFFEEKKFGGAVIHIEDITERIAAENKLKDSYKKLQKATEDIIQAMAFTTELRDPYTAGHQKRTRQLAIAIAEKMEISEHQMESLKFAGMIFDIGKISIPADILSKPGSINAAEIDVIKTHSQVGYEIIKKINFPHPIAPIVFQHHERINGSGYPNRIKGDEILLEAKILAVADVIEAMTSFRPYRAALSIEKALEEITSHKGKFYDPQVVDICLDLFHNDKFAFSG